MRTRFLIPAYGWLLPATLLLFACAAPPGGGGGGGAGKDAGQSGDAGTDGGTGLSDGGLSPGDPITAPLESWSFVEVAGAVCGNGAPTGVGVNLTERSQDVMVFLNGGGACWDVNTCFVLRSAVDIEATYGAARFENEPVTKASAFDRSNPNNPFRDMSFIFVPYCTGDLHAGNRVATYSALGQTRTVHHVGAANIEADLARLVATFPGAPRLFLSGSSAGGYGAQLNYERFAASFPNTEVHLLADSAQMIQPWGYRYGEMKAAWDLPSPPDCNACRREFPLRVDQLRLAHPDRRFALLGHEADQVLTVYFNYPLDGSFSNATNRLLSESYDPADNAHYFLLPGSEHVLLGGLTTLTLPGGPTLLDWVTRWVEGDATWTSAR